jgi:pyruvate,water dikinase
LLIKLLTERLIKCLTQYEGKTMTDYVLWFDGLGMDDVNRVGGKNASLGEMISHLKGMGVSVPNGFATTAHAFREFLDQSGLNDRIQAILSALDVNDVNALAKAGADIRSWVVATPFQPALEAAIKDAFVTLQAGNNNLAVAVRSSATAEDLPDASFAGQQETMLSYALYQRSICLAV